MASVRAPRPDLAERNRSNAVHSMSHTPTHVTWLAILDRCTNINSKDYLRYGGRGISIIPEWMVFTNFLADMGERPEGTTIDRIDVNGGYNPENCRWATPKQQCRNRRTSKMLTFRGETKCVAEWAEELGIERKCLQMRLLTKTVDEALSAPYVARRSKAA